MRSIWMALVVLTMTVVPAMANEDLGDARLQIHNLARNSGRQWADLTGVLAPSAQVRSATATVQVGATTVTLEGKIGRSGRLHLAGHRLDLAPELMAFDHIDVTIAGGFHQELTFDGERCTRSLRGRLLDCRTSLDGTGKLTDGVYDVTFDYGAGSTAEGLGRVTSRDDGSRGLVLEQSALDYAALDVTPALEITGNFVQGGDAVVGVTGKATDDSSRRVSRVNGTLTSTSPLPFHVAFAMERSVSGTPSALGGSWALHLEGGGPALDGMMTLVLDVSPRGVATTLSTAVQGTSGATLYTIGAGVCLVAPRGAVHCDLPITDPSDAAALHLHGVLDAAGASGGGTFAIGAAPMIGTQGTWTAAHFAPTGAH